MPPSPAFWRYFGFQLPGWALAAGVAWALMEYAGLAPWACAALVALWIAKDVALYPWLRSSYEPGDPHPAAQLAGRRARVTQRLDPDGYVQLGSERWRAVLEPPQSGPVESGETVRICGVAGLTLKVEIE